MIRSTSRLRKNPRAKSRRSSRHRKRGIGMIAVHVNVKKFLICFRYRRDFQTIAAVVCRRPPFSAAC